MGSAPDYSLTPVFVSLLPNISIYSLYCATFASGHSLGFSGPLTGSRQHLKPARILALRRVEIPTIELGGMLSKQHQSHKRG
uniref:Uncharacterized protein n=1 Tax=Picea glauca TaxID=3330 RepID=A0A124GMD3_PICGL|nr:hypothetical protein ABT39_MTgene3395 [Picea glauca]QHR88996.1 hypothetical protein Q903MT_gene3015 [Picea sitchensis]